MSLRRTGLQRKSELRRSGELARTPLARSKPLNAKRVRAARPKDTGPSKAQRAVVLWRSSGHCELCWALLHDGDNWLRAHSVHHRRPRRSGGDPRPTTNQPSNLLLLCGSATTPAGCHERVESNRTDALENGWLLHAEHEPTEVPVVIGPSRTRVLLDDDGNYQEAAA